MDEKELERLYKAMSEKFDVGDYQTFQSRMQTTDDRKRFYDAVSTKGIDLGEYKTFESRLSGATAKQKASPFGFEANKVDFNDFYGSLKNEARAQVRIGDEAVDMSQTFGPMTPENIKKKSVDLAERAKTGNVTTAELQSISSISGLPVEVIKRQVKDPEGFRDMMSEANMKIKARNFMSLDASANQVLAHQQISLNELMDNPAYGDAVLFNLKQRHDEDLKRISDEHPFMRINANAPVTIPREKQDEYDKKVEDENRLYSILLENIGIAAANEYARRNPEAPPMEIGLQYEKFANPERFKLREKAGGAAPHDRDIYLKGVQALYATGDPNAIILAEQDERMIDDVHPQVKTAKVYQKLGALMYKDGKNNKLFNRSPTTEDLQEAATKLDADDRAHFYKYILPVEQKNIGTDVPMSGLVNKFGEGVFTSTRDIVNTVRDIPFLPDGIERTEKEQAQDVLNRTYETRYQDVGSAPDAVATLKYLKSKPELTEQEQALKKELEQYTNVRSTMSEIFDGMGNVGGQVFVQAIGTKGLGNVFKSAATGAGILKSGRAIQALATEEMIASGATEIGISKGTLDNIAAAITSYAASYDSAKRVSLELFADDADSDKRALYANIVASANAASERIFKDQKVLDAFSTNLAPGVASLVRKISADELKKSSLTSQLKTVFKNGYRMLGETFVETNKEAVEEAVASAAEGTAKLLLAPSKYSEKDFFDDTLSAYTTTMLHGGIVGYVAARYNYKANHAILPLMSKMGLDQTFTDDVKNEMNRQFLDGDLSQADYDEKLKLLNNAIEINQKVMPTVKESGMSEKAGLKFMGLLMHEKNIEDGISQNEDPVIKRVMEKEVNAVRDLREKLFTQQLTVDENYNIIENTPEAIAEANPAPVIPVEEVSQDSAQPQVESIENLQELAQKGIEPDVDETEVKLYSEKLKPITSSIRNLARQIRDFEMKDSSGEKITGAMSDITAIPRHVLAAGLDVVAFSIENGASIADSINQSIAHMRSLHPEINEPEARDIIATQLENVWASNAPKAKVRKKDIKTATQTGKISGDPVVMSQRQALHKQIKDFIRGEKAGYKTGSVDEKQKSLDMAKRIGSVLDDAKNKGFISSQQWDSLFKRAHKIGTSGKRFDKFADYAEKVLEDADYQAKLDTGERLRDKVRTGVNSNKEKSAYTLQSAKRFAKIDPSKVEDIDAYNDLASKVVGIAEGLKASTKQGRAVTKNEAYETDVKAIDDYVQSHQEYASQKAKDKFVEDYSDLENAGIIDPLTMSLKEMKDLVEAINGPVDNAQRAAELFEAKQQRVQALRTAVDYNRSSLDTDPSNTQKENDIIEKLKALDISNLDAGTLAYFNDVINNIVINNDFTGSEKLAIMAEAQADIVKAHEAIQKAEIKDLGSIRSTLLQGFASIALQHEFIFKSTRLAAKIQHLSGIADIFSGHARAQVLQNQVMEEERKLKKGMKGIDLPINRIRRGILAYVTNNFGGTPDEINTEFNRTKNWILQSGQRLSKSDVPAEAAEGELIMQVYSEILASAENAADVLQASTPDNIKVVEFWRQQFEARKDQTKANAELLNNMLWEDVEHYTATKMKTLGGPAGMTQEEIKEVFTNNFISNKLNQQIAGSKFKRVRSPNLPADKVIDLDFDKVQSQVFYRTNYDVETSAAIEKVSSFFGDDRSNAIFGGPGNKKVVMNSVREAVNAQRGQLPPSTPADKVVNKLTSMLQAKGFRIALGSLSQVIKQYPSVAINTMINLGADAPLFGKAFMVPNNIKLFNQLPIGLRGEAKAGFNKDVKIQQASEMKLGNHLSNITDVIQQKSEKVSDAVMAALVKSDVSVARTSWLAYYMQDLKRQGLDIDAIDWKVAHENINQEAAAYAEQQVSRTQNPNDVSSGAAFYRDARGTSGFFKNVVLPFSTFVVNARVRMTSDVQKILHGGNKSEALRSLAGTAAEMVTFNAVKTYIIATLTTMGARGIAELFGMWDEEDEKQAENREQLTIQTKIGEATISAKTKRMVANAASDFFFSGLGSLTQAAANEGMNSLYKMAATEYYADGQMNKYPSLYYSRSATDKSPDFSPYGLYGTLATKLASMRASGKYAITGKYPGVDDAYDDLEVTLSPEERKLYTISFIVDALGVVGISDADILMMNQRLKWIADKEMGDKYGVQNKLMERNMRSKY
ncbi:MAG: hypothetical protein ACTHMM_26980 [Agriterribacter sp.]